MNGKPNILVIGREQLWNSCGNTNYLVAMMHAMRGSFSVDCLILKHKVFCPFFVRLPRALEGVRIRILDCVRLGPFYISVAPISYVSAVLKMGRFVLRALGFNIEVLQKKMTRAIAGDPTSINFPSAREIETVKSFVEANAKHYSCVVVSRMWLAPLLDLFAAQPTLKTILTHDIIAEGKESFALQQFPRDDLVGWTMDKEIAQWSKADLLLASQSRELETIKKFAPKLDAVLVSMAASLHAISQNPIAGRCLFIGSDHPANRYNLQWFLEHVWPLVLAECPQASFDVVGKVCNEFSAHYKNVRFHGPVHDLGPFYADAQLCVFPIIIGSGLKIKVVEAFAHGKASVGTAVALQGLETSADKAMLLAGGATDFAAHMVLLFKDFSKRSEMEKNALAYARVEFSEGIVYRELFDRIYSFAGRRV